MLVLRNAFLFCLVLCANSVLGQDKFITQHSLVKVQKGVWVFGELIKNDATGISLVNSYQDTISYQKDQVRRILLAKKQIFFRSDRRYVYSNYFGFKFRTIISDFGNLNTNELTASIGPRIQVSIFNGRYIEENIWADVALGGALRYYWAFSNRQRWYSEALYFHTVSDNEFNWRGVEQNSEIVSFLNVGFGFDVMSRRRIKFDLSAGANLRYIQAESVFRDDAGNPVVLLIDSYGISAYVDFSIKFKLFHY